MPPFDDRNVVIPDVFTRETMASALRIINDHRLMNNVIIANQKTMETLLNTVVKFGVPLHLPDIQYTILSLRKMQ